MEKSTLTKTSKSEFLTLDNRKNLTLSGVAEVISSSDKELIVRIGDSRLSISGNNINISKLDTESGDFEAIGEFNEFIYGKKLGFFKRIFK